MPYYPAMTCTCGRRVTFRDLWRIGPNGRQQIVWACPACDSPVRVSRKYSQLEVATVFLLVAIIAALTYTPNSSGGWILKILASFIPLRIAYFRFVPPALEAGEEIDIEASRTGLFTLLVITMFLVALLEFTALGWVHFFVRGSQREMTELLDMFSLPLGWISPGFVLRPTKSFVDVCGVILGNSLFYAIPFSIGVTVVRKAFRRSRVTQIGITGFTGQGDDEDGP